MQSQVKGKGIQSYFISILICGIQSAEEGRSAETILKSFFKVFFLQKKKKNDLKEVFLGSFGGEKSNSKEENNWSGLLILSVSSDLIWILLTFEKFQGIIGEGRLDRKNLRRPHKSWVFISFWSKKLPCYYIMS